MFSGKRFAWARILRWDQGLNRSIEINLTPRPGWWSSTWDSEVRCLRLRSCSRHPNDRVVRILPAHVKNELVKNLGADAAHQLLTEDFLSQINWTLFEAADQEGGVELESIRIRNH